MPSSTPAPLLALHALSYSTPDGRTVLDAIELAFSSERTGLVGRNGAGKSTLIRIATGALVPTGGSLERAGRIGVLRQIVQIGPEETVADGLGVAVALAQLDRLAAGAGSLSDAAEADWTLEGRIRQAMADVDLGDLALGRPLASLSGGQRTRLALAALLLDDPDMLLLDEPTNNLDAGGRAAIGRILANWKKGAIVVSHDRAILRGMDRIVELSTLGARSYGGGYDFYAERKAEERSAALRNLDLAQREIVATERRIQASRERQARSNARGERNRARGDQPKMFLDARQARSERTAGSISQLAEKQRGSAIDALAEAEAEVERIQTLGIHLPSTGLPAGRSVLAFERVGFGFRGADPLFGELDLAIAGPERIALTGRNGAGKTTFLKLATGEIEPDSGIVRRPVASVMLDQGVSLLDPQQTILENFQRINPDTAINHAHAVLARFLYRNQAALKPVRTLSGGEMLRAGLACVLGNPTPPGLLILDEPTNHLDLDSIAAVEAALRDFDGALLIASHDEDFLAAVGITRRLVFPLAQTA